MQISSINYNNDNQSFRAITRYKVKSSDMLVFMDSLNSKLEPRTAVGIIENPFYLKYVDSFFRLEHKFQVLKMLQNEKFNMAQIKTLDPNADIFFYLLTEKDLAKYNRMYAGFLAKIRGFFNGIEVLFKNLMRKNENNKNTLVVLQEKEFFMNVSIHNDRSQKLFDKFLKGKTFNTVEYSPDVDLLL